MSEIDRGPVVRGAAIAAVLAIAAGITQHLVSSTSSLSYALLLLILAAMAFGGYVAAKPQPELALTAGGMAALIGCTAAQLLNLVFAVTVSGKSVSGGNLVFIVFIVLVATSFGVIGGYVAFRTRERGETAAADHSTGGNDP